MATSSANPFKLGTYSSDGLELTTTLKTTSTAVTEALDVLRTSASPHLPALGTADSTLADLVGDWQHLDEFAGDVANGFVQSNQGLLDRGPRPGQESLVMTLSDDSLGRLGQVGYADRDVAVAEANRLADDLRAGLDEGELSPEEMAALSERAARGQYDPAFAVTLLENLGVEDTVRIPALVEASWPGAMYGDNPGWGQPILLPFATVLRTAMDTRAATRTLDRHDPDNEDLADDDRLSEAWVDEFASFWQPDDFDQPNNVHFSLLVRHAELPTDVLVEVADRQLDYMLAHDATPQAYMNGIPWGYEDSVAEVNILGALGHNQDASLQWLDQQSPGDCTFGYPGRTATNLEMLLRYDPGMPADPRLGGALATVVDNGLHHWDDRSDALFDVAVETIADQDAVHVDQLLPVLGEGARTHIDQLAARTREVVPGTVGQADQSALGPLHEAHDFLQVLMTDDAAANSVYKGGLEYARDLVVADTGDGFGGEARSIGGLMGLVTEADENAAVEVTEQRIATRESFVKGTNLLKDVVSLTPAGVPLRAAAVGLYHLNNFGVPGADGLDLDADYATIENVRTGIRAQLTATTAAYEYGVQGTWTSDEVLATTTSALGTPTGADVDFFVDGTSGDNRPIKPFVEMSPDEQRAYNAWLNSDQVGDAIAGDRTVAGQRMDEVVDSLEHR